MLTFKQLVAEMAREDVNISPAEVDQMKRRFGDKVLQMGHLQDDGSLMVPVDCIIESVRELGPAAFSAGADSINNEDMVSMLQSGELLVARVAEAREHKLRRMVRAFQHRPSHDQWQEIEKELFGVEYRD